MNPKKIFDFIGKNNPKYDLNLKSYIGLDPRLVQFMDNPTEEQKKYFIREYPELFYTIKNPSIELQIHAIKSSDNPINDFSHKTKKRELSDWFDLDSFEIQYALVRKDPILLIYLKEPDEGLKLEAVHIDPTMIKYIFRPSEEVQLLAVSKDGILIGVIVDPSEQVQLAAIENDVNSFYFIHNPTERVKKRFKYLTEPDDQD
jgi:hypothetical protein